MKYLSLFTGIGGLDAGVAGRMKCVGFSEIRPSSISCYLKHYPTHKNLGDLTAIDFKALPDFDLLLGGFPCQSFSLAGLRGGFQDRRGKMIFHIYDLLMAKKPEFVVLENVKGLLSHEGGRTYRRVVKLLAAAGYQVRVLLLNSAHHGLAQNRERVFFLAARQDFPALAPRVVDDSKRFRDVRDDRSAHRDLPRTKFNIKKLNQERDFNFEVIGGYDRVGALTTENGCGEKAVPNGKGWFRYLTPLECERLQGFPEGWTEGLKPADRFFALGNAVSFSVSQYLFNEYLAQVWWKTTSKLNAKSKAA